MAKRGKRRRPPEDTPDDDVDTGRARRRRRKRRDRLASADAPAAVRPPRVVTCHECRHLVVTRSVVKTINQSWDRAVSFPTLTCFQQRWTLDDPESQTDLSVATEFLIGGADRCPDFAPGYPVDPMTWFEEQTAWDGRRGRRR